MTSALRVLIVEDEMLVAMLIEDMLYDLGHVPVGPATRLEAGLRLAAESEDLDVAILDVNLAGETSFPIADLLTSKGIPVIFATGYGSSGLTEAYSGTPTIAKPFSAAALTEAIRTVAPR